MRKNLGAAAIALVICGVLSGSAWASVNQRSVIEDSGRILGFDPIGRETALDEARDLGADIIKLPVLWSEVAPASNRRARPVLDLADPAAYSDLSWSRIDAAVFGAQIRGMQVWMMVTAPAPEWATSRKSKPTRGAHNPDPAAYADFVTAVSTRYPSVRIWSIWNEPNLSRFLQPQFKGGVAVSAIHYRKLYRAAYAALQSTGHGTDTILFGELLPRAPAPKRINGTVPPVMWLRDFLCLDRELRPYRGRQAKIRECDGFAPIDASGMAYHPYTTAAGPRFRDSLQENATISHLSRIYRVLDAAARHNHLSRSGLPIYNSEFGFQSAPPDRGFAPLGRVPSYMNDSEYLSYRDRRVATYSQYLLVDDLDLGGFQSGLRFADGRPKPGVYGAFALPTIVLGGGRTGVRVWACLRAKGSGSEIAEIQTRLGGSFKTIVKVTVHSENGCFTRSVRITRSAARTFRVKWGAITGRSARPVVAPTSFR